MPQHWPPQKKFNNIHRIYNLTMLGLLARAGALQYKHMGLFQPA